MERQLLGAGRRGEWGKLYRYRVPVRGYEKVLEMAGGCDTM